MIPDTLAQLAVIVLVALPLALLFLAVGRRIAARRAGEASRQVALTRLHSWSAMSDEEKEAVIYWRLHNRGCRRALARAGLGPSSPAHLLRCVCGGPARAMDLAIAEMRRSA